MPLSGQLCGSLFGHLPDSVFLIDPHTAHVLDCNDTAVQRLGLPRSAILNQSILNLMVDAPEHASWALLVDTVRVCRDHLFVGRYRQPGGHVVPVEIHTRCFVDGGREYLLSVVRTLRRPSLPDNSSRDAQLRYALTESSDGLWDWNLHTDAVFFSPQLQRMLGFDHNNMPPTLHGWRDNIHPDDAPWVHNVVQEHLDGRRERYQADYRLRNRNGHYLWVHDRGCVCERDASGKPTRMVGMMHNITDHKTTELLLQNIASRDPLTGLLNRRECDRVLARQIDLCQRLQVPLALCFFDLDHFKQVNDLLGHHVGDKVLQRVAVAVEQVIRSTDYLFRWGGEEFLLLCTDTPKAHALALATTLKTAINGIDWSDMPHMPTLTCSFGVALYPEHADQAESLFIAADSALYRAKANGRNRVECAHHPAPPSEPRATRKQTTSQTHHTERWKTD